jgi:hypothetical protein
MLGRRGWLRVCVISTSAQGVTCLKLSQQHKGATMYMCAYLWVYTAIAQLQSPPSHCYKTKSCLWLFISLGTTKQSASNHLSPPPPCLQGSTASPPPWRCRRAKHLSYHSFRYVV